MLTFEYLAGLFDGEGSLHAVRNRPGWGASVSIGVCNETVIDQLLNQFGGSKRKQITKAGREFFVWRVGVYKGLDFLSGILPYRIIKKEVIKVGIALGKLMQRKRKSGCYAIPLDENEVYVRTLLVAKISALNNNMSLEDSLAKIAAP